MNVYKYPLELTGNVQAVEMPEGAQILHVADQGGPTIWALVDPKAPTTKRYFGVFGTGHDCPEDGYVGTTHAGGFVWHIFEAPAEPALERRE